MKAIVATAPDRLDFKDYPLPEPKCGQVRIKTAVCGICATDLEIISGWERTAFPAIPGHEWSGTVDMVGNGADKAMLGRRCVAENVLHDGSEVGFEHPGGYAEYFLTETDKLHFLPDDFPVTVATLIEPLAVSTRALRRLGLRDKSSALVIGDGPIGLLMTMLLKRAGVRDIVMLGGREKRMALAKTMGAGQVLNYHLFRKDDTEAIAKTLGRSFPNIIEASGAAAAVNMALIPASKMTKVLVVGDYKKALANFAWNHLLLNELELIGSNASAQAWPEAVQTAISMQQNLSKLISMEYSAARFVEAFAAVKRDREMIKVVLRWDYDIN